MTRHRQSRGERRWIAYHEAGHAVVAHVVGFRINWVSVDRRRRELREDGRWGRWGGCSISYRGPEELLPLADLVMTRAGDLAAQEWAPVPGSRSGRDDREDARRILDRAGPGWAELQDRATFRVSLLLHHPPMQAAIHSLAARLLKRAHLDGPEATSIIDEALSVGGAALDARRPSA